MSTANAAAAAALLLWLGMVLAISFLEAPLKFRAPGVTLPIGLGIGRLVFRALNAAELVAAVAAVVAVIADPVSTPAVVAMAVALACLAAQLLLVRPALTRRSDAVLASAAPESLPRSRAHLFYVGLELVKVIGLATAGWVVLTR